ncbi:MAG: type II secretion system protein [Candidatus Levybacteria bacterium]|nr:type II secretion system protein [Candidatus Levybacteria bacterium]
MKISERLALRKRSASKGFTLVELLIVIAVIGILATVLIVALNPVKQLQKGRDVQRKTGLKAMQNAIEAYYADNGSYPPNDCFSGSTGSCWRLGVNASTILGLQGANYIKALPNDPSLYGTACTESTSYGFFYDTNAGTTYTLVTRLENTSDPQAIPNSLPGCHANYNYALTNQQ